MGMFSKNTQQNKNISNEMRNLIYAAQQGDVEAQCDLAFCLLDGDGIQKNVNDALSWFTTSAERGCVRAQTVLGLLYSMGDKIAPNDYESFKWHKRAAEQGNAISQRAVGDCYCNGKGTRKDFYEAKKWYLKALEQEDQFRQEDLADIYRNLSMAFSMLKDKQNSWIFMKKAAENGDSLSQFLLATELYQDKTNPANIEKAVELMTEVANKGIVPAYVYLGNIYEEDNRYKNISEAIRYYKLAAEQNDEEGLYHLGRCYEYGIGVITDYAKAMELYHKSAAGEANVEPAMNAIGDMYLNGRGVMMNIDEAKRWYQSAVDQGDEKAKKKLEEISIAQSSISSKSKSDISEDESEYLEAFKEYLAEGEISYRERRLLEKLRTAYGISEVRARELENSLKSPQLSDNEKKYLEDFKSLLEDGELSGKDRKMLNKLRVAYGISEERARELEQLA